jgi:hypothetical protein
MNDDSQHRTPEQGSGPTSIARRREILKRIGMGAAAAGAAASPMAAMAGSARKWCKHPTDTTKCVHASISGMASVVMSAQASNEVCSKKCSHYANYANWPGSCTNGTQAITCNNSNDSYNTKFCVAFKCEAWTAQDSHGRPRYVNGVLNTDCLLNKSLKTLCNLHSGETEAHWATALGNANKLMAPTTGAPFPYTPGNVVSFYGDPAKKAAAYTFFSTYCEQYA